MTQRPRITSRNNRQIDLSDGSFVLARGSMSWRAIQMLKDFAPSDGEDEPDMTRQFESSLKFLKEAIVGWNFIDEKGEAIPFDSALIDDFDVETVSEVFVAIQKLYLPEKKSLPSSTPTSPKDSSEEVQNGN